MKVSICITTLNEEKSILRLLDSLSKQSRKPDEVIICDGGSSDATASLIQEYQKQNKNIKLIKVKKRVSIAKGRNIAVKNAKYLIIAMTDAGCVLDKNWLKNISEPFHDKKTDVVAGFYEMTGKSEFQKALKPFLGIMPDKFDGNFLPATRSIAFKKNVWKKVGGFNEKFDRAGEDTYFNFKILEQNFKIVRTKNAIVEWEVPDNISDAAYKFYYYARGDAQSSKLLTQHNKKVLTIFGRYVIFAVMPFLFFLYLLFPILKFKKYKYDSLTLAWAVIIQVVSDFSVMLGFTNGISKTNN